MNTVMKKFVRVPMRYVILLVLILAAGISYYYFLETDNSKLSALIGGICGGIIVYIISFLISIYEYRSIDRFRELGVKEVLPNRRGTGYYKTLVANAKDLVTVTGTSCTRFIDDFANEDNDDHILIDALRKNKHLKVQILIPNESHMDDLSLSNFCAGEIKLRNLLHSFSGRMEVRRFDFEPRYSFVRVDNDLVVGPVFVKTESQDSPAIHLDVNSSYSEKYLSDFVRVWENSQVYK